MRLRADGVTWQEIDGELVLLDLNSSTYLTTNAAGTLLARTLADADGATEDQLVGALVREYGIDESVARTDTTAFLADLRHRGLLHD
ncbi:coenzyme PQQ synthesis protein D (PqqD) [Isoptericola sp. CG 20/1183]|uniref:Coenzyme PQQ synthesis protein D (PqqD) n=1 Tax=Isoptericola halotolerans TaxID=300560 RepID=A0ABX5EDF8_9MICO|nr:MULTISPECIES: PqqD family protein [Isoptericola]MCK0117886.1 PqqD family protein [Isoptericola sp. S6320L]PRZ06435.1 coenzyme PQQ synthesis protein D (PqqD) [Isoptericola halotolerans]PRZ06759.1 coenzyme PQQ synthesis protein D (PqqD) [Isoptericola sp. CG 20/1183]